MVVPPNLVDFAEAAGLNAVAYGLDSQPILDLQRKYFTCYSRTPWKLKELNRMSRETEQFATQCWADMTSTLVSEAEGADLLLTGLIFEQPAANVAEYQGIPLVTLHYFPARAHGQLLPFVPAPVSRIGMTINDWVAWRATRKGEDAQRRELGLPRATRSAPRRISSGSAPMRSRSCSGFAASRNERGHHHPLQRLLKGADHELLNRNLPRQQRRPRRQRLL
jgi:UDP:flavonoid glycosyltransferase YjiC (YdhE family)